VNRLVTRVEQMIRPPVGKGTGQEHASRAEHGHDDEKDPPHESAHRVDKSLLVSASVEVSTDGKAMKFYEVTPFEAHLTPETIATAARTLSAENDDLEIELR
jgi:hypothetical protein